MPATSGSISSYPPLNVQVHTPRLSLLGATDELLERLVPVVRKGVVTVAPWPFDDPMSLYKDSPDREWAWLRGVWAGRAKVSDSCATTSNSSASPNACRSSVSETWVIAERRGHQLRIDPAGRR
jgi:hypothetical protein